MRGWLLAGATAAMTLLGSGAHAQKDITSGNYYLSACQAFATNNFSMAFESGQCAGFLQAVISGTKNGGIVCIPSKVTLGQVAKVVVQYLENHPQILEQDFILLASYAVGATWPCTRQR